MGLIERFLSLFGPSERETFTDWEVEYLRFLIGASCSGPLDILLASKLKKGRELGPSELYRLKVLVEMNWKGRSRFNRLRNKLSRMYREVNKGLEC